MKQYFLLLVAIASFLTSCGEKKPSPPIPDPKPVERMFDIDGVTLRIKGEVKKDAKVTAEQAKAALNVAVQVLDSK